MGVRKIGLPTAQRASSRETGGTRKESKGLKLKITEGEGTLRQGSRLLLRQNDGASAPEARNSEKQRRRKITPIFNKAVGIPKAHGGTDYDEFREEGRKKKEKMETNISVGEASKMHI